MTSIGALHHDPPARDEAVRLAIAGSFIDALAVRDFDAIAATLADEVHFRALLPSRVLELRGNGAVRGAFMGWFGRATLWELTEAVVGEVGGRVHLRWRARVTDHNIGEGTFVVEQQVYADAGTDGRFHEVALLCTGFRPEASS